MPEVCQVATGGSCEVKVDIWPNCGVNLTTTLLLQHRNSGTRTCLVSVTEVRFHSAHGTVFAARSGGRSERGKNAVVRLIPTCSPGVS